MKSKYTVVDLFAGAGGLSLGFVQTGHYEIKVAFENNPAMQQTYKANHPNVDVYGDVCNADYNRIEKQYGKIDVVIGGPPCQGFSNANRQKNHVVNQNNMLVKQYIRAIKELRPKAFLMENVSMLKSEVHRFYLSDDENALVNELRIKTKPTKIQLIDANAYFPEAIDIVKNEALIEQLLWPEEKYSVLNVIYKASRNPQKLIKALDKYSKVIVDQANKTTLVDGAIKQNKEEEAMWKGLMQYYDGTLAVDKVVLLLEKPIKFQRMLSRAKELYDNHLIVDDYIVDDGLSASVRSYAVYDYLKAVLGSEEYGYVISDKVLCSADYGAPQKRKRYVVVGIKKTISNIAALPHGIYDEDEYFTVRQAIEDLEEISPLYDTKDDEEGLPLSIYRGDSELIKLLRDSSIIKNHVITRTTPIAMERFKAIKEGENFHSLKEEMKSNTYTNAERTQNTVYLRLKYDEPSGTVVNVRKSMWIHPKKDRAISIREAARLQTFPDSFVFYGSKDKQYQQVGNAVPPIMAKAIATKMSDLLSKKQ